MSGLNTGVFFRIECREICGRVEPNSAAGPGETTRLHANMDNLHLIDPQSGAAL